MSHPSEQLPLYEREAENLYRVGIMTPPLSQEERYAGREHVFKDIYYSVDHDAELQLSNGAISLEERIADLIANDSQLGLVYGYSNLVAQDSGISFSLTPVNPAEIRKASRAARFENFMEKLTGWGEVHMPVRKQSVIFLGSQATSKTTA